MLSTVLVLEPRRNIRLILPPSLLGSSLTPLIPNVTIRNFSSMPNSSCVLGFADLSASRGWPVLIAESMPRYLPTTDGEYSWDAWFGPFFDTLLPHPAVQGWSYIDRDCSAHSTTRTKCVGGLWGDARIEAKGAGVVGERYTRAVANTSAFVHGDTLAATCSALRVSGCS